MRNTRRQKLAEIAAQRRATNGQFLRENSNQQSGSTDVSSSQDSSPIDLSMSGGDETYVKSIMVQNHKNIVA